MLPRNIYSSNFSIDLSVPVSLRSFAFFRICHRILRLQKEPYSEFTLQNIITRRQHALVLRRYKVDPLSHVYTKSCTQSTQELTTFLYSRHPKDLSSTSDKIPRIHRSQNCTVHFSKIFSTFCLVTHFLLSGSVMHVVLSVFPTKSNQLCKIEGKALQDDHAHCVMHENCAKICWSRAIHCFYSVSWR